ncbi:hypothetical protein [Flavilitoribacter nigricans]|nr:hypothetical protein [Flavilitoribacter nigricans]
MEFDLRIELLITQVWINLIRIRDGDYFDGPLYPVVYSQYRVFVRNTM